VARRGSSEIHNRFWRGNLNEIVLLEGLGIDGKIILQWVIKKRNGARISLFWFRIGSRGGLF
jgi:hypothetical protein